jgi:hypothetical protein
MALVSYLVIARFVDHDPAMYKKTKSVFSLYQLGDSHTRLIIRVLDD